MAQMEGTEEESEEEEDVVERKWRKSNLRLN